MGSTLWFLILFVMMKRLLLSNSSHRLSRLVGQGLFAALALLLGVSGVSAQTFTGEGDYKTAERWDTGTIPVDGATVVINGVAEISDNIGVNNADNPARMIIGQETEGTLVVSGGTLSGANGGGAGIFVGAGPGGVGRVDILPGTGLRSQGGNMVFQVGDEDGGVGFVSVGGELLNYKFFRIVNGTLEMLPTGINNRFNQLDTISTIETDGTLSYVIDGDKIGSLERANGVGLNVDIFPAATLKITLEGEFEVNDSWVLMRYHTLIGQFAQGTSFTNQQGYSFAVDYGNGEDDEVVLTLTSTAGRPSINSFGATPPGIAAGSSTELNWEVGQFSSLSIEPNVGDVGGMTTNGAGSVAVSPEATTTYVLTLENNGASIESAVTVVVDEAPLVETFSVAPGIIAPGSSATLEWVVAGADSVSIEPSVGGVDASGSVSVSPADSTTYTLTAVNANGSTTSEVVVVVDAIQASLAMSFDAAAPRQASGAIFDVLSGASFDLKTTVLDTQISSFTTTLTAAYRLTEFGGASGGDGNSFPGGTTSYEAWVRTGELDANPQVIFETGESANGSSLLISADAVQFYQSQDGERTHVVSVPLTEIDLSDFVHIVATLDQSSGELAVYVRGAAGGAASATANGSVGLPNGRASLFNWTNFSAGVAGALGGIGSEVPAGVTLFRGELALLNVYDRALDASEVENLFGRVAIPDPGLIQSFAATPDRVGIGEAVTLSWEVGAFDSLTLVGPGGGEVASLTANGSGSQSFELEQSARYSLVAVNAEGASTASLLVLVGVAPDVVVLTQNADSWENASAWADGAAPSSGKDYLVTDFVAGSLAAPADFDVSFGGDSLELLGEGARLQVHNDLTDNVTIPELRLSGGVLELTGIEGVVNLDGSVVAVQDSDLDVRGTLNTLVLDAAVSGSGNLTVTASPATLEDDETLILAGNNSGFDGGWTFVGGRTFASDGDSLGSGDILLVNANLELGSAVSAPNSGVIIQGNSALVLFDDATVQSINFRLGDGSSVSIPAGSYTFSSWTDLAEGLGLNSLQLDLVGGATLEVQEEVALPTAGTLFSGTGDWSSAENWSDGVPLDGSNAIVNGSAEISDNIGSSNADNPSRIFVGDNAVGELNVTGGTLSGAHSGANAGIFIGRGPAGDGTVSIAEGAALRSQGGGMVVRIGDESGGVGRLSVAGQLFNFKFFELINGTLEMRSTGVNNSFNSADVSFIGSDGTLAFEIDGEQVGGLLRANTTGLVLEIDSQATLSIELNGAVSEGQSWVLMDYTSLVGSFAQGTEFTNEQGHTFAIDYGSGDNDVVTLTALSLNPDALVTEPARLGIVAGESGLVLDYTGTLQSATTVDGPYEDVADATSPYQVATDEPQRFFRVR